MLDNLSLEREKRAEELRNQLPKTLRLDAHASFEDEGSNASLRRKFGMALFIVALAFPLIAVAFLAGRVAIPMRAQERAKRLSQPVIIVTDSTEDIDRDKLDDQIERALGTDPTNWDTDGDGYSDKEESDAGYNPLEAASENARKGWMVVRPQLAGDAREYSLSMPPDWTAVPTSGGDGTLLSGGVHKLSVYFKQRGSRDTADRIARAIVARYPERNWTEQYTASPALINGVPGWTVDLPEVQSQLIHIILDDTQVDIFSDGPERDAVSIWRVIHTFSVR